MTTVQLDDIMNQFRGPMMMVKESFLFAMNQETVEEAFLNLRKVIIKHLHDCPIDQAHRHRFDLPAIREIEVLDCPTDRVVIHRQVMELILNQREEKFILKLILVFLIFLILVHFLLQMKFCANHMILPKVNHLNQKSMLITLR